MDRAAEKTGELQGSLAAGLGCNGGEVRTAFDIPAKLFYIKLHWRLRAGKKRAIKESDAIIHGSLRLGVHQALTWIDAITTASPVSSIQPKKNALAT